MNPNNIIELKSKSGVGSNTNVAMSSSANSEDGKKLLNQISSIFKGITWETEGETIVSYPYLLAQPQKVKIIKDLLVSGTPMHYRKIFWLNASGALREKRNNPNVYKNLTEFYPEFIPSPFASQIEIDLLRTYPDTDYFKTQENIAKLRNVLLAFSRRNVSLGYVQGFNFIVGRLLMFFDSEEDVFWIFTQVLECFFPIEYFYELAGVMNDCVVANFILQKELPDVVGHLTTLGNEMCLNNVLFQWFDSLFAQNINEDIWFHTWDLMFLEGTVAIFKATIAIFRIMRTELLETKSMDDLFPLLDRVIADIQPKKFLLEILKMKSTDELNTIDILRKFFLQRTIETLEKSLSFKSSTKKKQEDECQIAWPVCMKEIALFNIQKAFIIRQFNKIKVDESFFEGDVYEKKREVFNKKWSKEAQRIKLNSKQDKSLLKLKLFKHLLIERRVHTCDKTKQGCLLKLSDANTFTNINYTKGVAFMLDIISIKNDINPEVEIENIIQKVKTYKSKEDIESTLTKNNNKNTHKKCNDSDDSN